MKDFVEPELEGFLDLSTDMLAKQKNAVIGFLENSVKRDLDVIGALAFLLLCSPVFLILTVIVSLDGGPAYFAHRRVGKNGIMFGCLKFRTMMMGAEECLAEYFRYHPEARIEWDRAQKLQPDPRVTNLGNFLRRTNLDEIPQMWGVLTGKMSLVGPRPVTAMEMETRYGRYADVVTSVRPGITGPWQIVPNRNSIDYDDRVALDFRYAKQHNLLTDLVIICRTVMVMWRSDRAG